MADNNAANCALCAHKSDSGLRPKEQNGPRMIWSQVLVQGKFCQAPIDFVRRKLARNQTFMARCVPNMYLFGTFSAQNTAEMAR